MIRVVKGDLIKAFKTGEVNAIAHGANCKHIMGAGVARVIKQEVPEAFAADKGAVLGSYTFADLGSNRLVFNLYTQRDIGKCASYDALWNSLSGMRDTLSIGGKHYKWRVGLPRIGCGIGGLRWEVVHSIIDVVFEEKDWEVTVYTL